MSYKLKIPIPIKEQIASWNLPREMLIQVYTRLNTDLAMKSKAELREVVAPIRAYLYQFTLPDALGVQHLFIFHVGFENNEKTIHVRHCYHDSKSKE